MPSPSCIESHFQPLLGTSLCGSAGNPHLPERRVESLWATPPGGREQMPGMLAEFSKFETKAKLLKSVAGFAPDSALTRKRWEDFQDRLEGVHRVIEAQLEKMKSAVNTSLGEYMARDRLCWFWGDSERGHRKIR